MAEKKKSSKNKFAELSVKELVQNRTKLRQELYELKMKNAIKWLKQTHQITQIRRNIARINTFLTSKIKEKYGNNMK